MGREVLEAADAAGVRHATRGLREGSVGAYVQLPVGVLGRGTTAVERIQDFLTGGLVDRYAAAADALPLLARGASIALVAGNRPEDSALPDDSGARLALLRLLAKAIVADGESRQLRAIVINRQMTPGQIATAVFEDPDARRLRVLTNAADSNPEMSYDAWRLELLSAVSLEL